MATSSMAHYTCPVDGQDFPSKQQLEEHMTEGHNKQARQNTTSNGVHCPTCDLPFRTIEEMATHQRAGHAHEANADKKS